MGDGDMWTGEPTIGRDARGARKMQGECNGPSPPGFLEPSLYITDTHTGLHGWHPLSSGQLRRAPAQEVSAGSLGSASSGALPHSGRQPTGASLAPSSSTPQPAKQGKSPFVEVKPDHQHCTHPRPQSRRARRMTTSTWMGMDSGRTNPNLESLHPTTPTAPTTGLQERHSGQRTHRATPRRRSCGRRQHRAASVPNKQQGWGLRRRLWSSHSKAANCEHPHQ